ncbi:DUF1868 domain-containing protein [Calothrix sp. FACHB-1219]|uniref:DUF1868 domain-containing protein n=1 Tax=unclassified Calothrix TaxID=2619626 RepID=UPI00168576EA|nr:MULTISPECIES: DUF1868 domain-containing protein [unclassified Calothrix]MBD2206021.1 DUF1868 domain-containing protein [Calothrix sp. FACHB-168]MBD2220804.1 DUF1868 domain-containing protein [Calothrix sp. FACHB-1219]
MDDNYQTYLNRVARMTLPEAYRSQVQRIQESSKFQPDATGSRKAVPFPGYTLITPPAVEATENSAFYAQLQSYQQQLLQLSADSNLIVPVPSTSFHLTLADLIWDSAYRHALEENPQFEQELSSCIANIFEDYKKSLSADSQPIYWQVLGLMVMPRAIGVCLVPQDETCYEQVIKFRRMVYQTSQLMALGIEQHYHFTAHITLGYFGEITPELDRTDFSTKLSELNQQWPLNSPDFFIDRVELRKFDDMTSYNRQPDWPSLVISQ